MFQDVTTACTDKMDYSPSFSIPSTVEAKGPIRLFGSNKHSRNRFEKFIVSSNITLPSCILNETVSSGESLRILTPVQAYKVALNALNTFERKWDVYVKEQARLLSVFDEDEE